ncbi:malto-oligosyltrehalose synthase [Prosthecomicrobium sp. N25]|uniref:malto-oligosyltrehalose synthase n=1 Tax=Prosthecomicrobium sp. N25 TaxID=3129254 RepID=UPI0030786625
MAAAVIRNRLRATYRLQFEKDFTFADAERLVPYLVDLGVSHLYASPIFQARPGSRHGYDIVDHAAVNPELGGEAAFRSFARACKAAGLGIMLDIVPNHAGIAGSDNAAWLDALEFGPRSLLASRFDIDWRRGPVTLAVLDAPLADVVAAGRIRAEVDAPAGRILAVWHDTRLPLRPASYAGLADPGQDGEGAEAFAAWAATDDLALPAEERDRLRDGLAAALADPVFMRAVQARLADPDRLADLLGRQNFRLVPWQLGAAALTYRRFFDITDLAGLRVEDPDVFEALHRLPLGFVREGLVDGLRVDHVDGLADPEGYCRRLRAAVGSDVTIHLEKILGPDEELRDWPVDGTTGYEYLNRINGLFVDPDGYARLAGYAGSLGLPGTPEERVADAKREILATGLRGELRTLAALAAGLVKGRGAEDLPRAALRRALVELIAALPVYRTYIAGEVSAEDRRLLATAAEEAAARLGPIGRRALEAVLGLLLFAPGRPGPDRFRRRFQQLSGPAMAKGYEDTELYRFPGLLSVNEVGSHLTHPATAPEAFHAAAARIAERHPACLVALSTHDTKRGSDTRARLNLLSEMPDDWLALCRAWSERHAPLRRRVEGGPAPDAVDEAFLYQTLFGAWPVSADRVAEYWTKALREAKRHTAWVGGDPAYEAAAMDFARALLEGPDGEAFRADMAGLVERTCVAGRRNGLSQTVLQLTMPGVPDVYRGSERWDPVLVDPDNRRPLDWEAITAGLAAEVLPDLERDHDGLAKQRVVADLLALRGASPHLFVGAPYQPLAPVGAGGVVAFMRRTRDEALVVAVSTRALAPGEDVVAVPVPLQRWSLRQSIVGGPAEVADNALRLRRSALPLAVVLDCLPD